ncbi:hypothetical protein GCM10027258_93020 [Amycolatopsis stemonae]
MIAEVVTPFMVVDMGDVSRRWSWPISHLRGGLHPMQAASPGLADIAASCSKTRKDLRGTRVEFHPPVSSCATLCAAQSCALRNSGQQWKPVRDTPPKVEGSSSS